MPASHSVQAAVWSMYTRHEALVERLDVDMTSKASILRGPEAQLCLEPHEVASESGIPAPSHTTAHRPLISAKPSDPYLVQYHSRPVA